MARALQTGYIAAVIEPMTSNQTDLYLELNGSSDFVNDVCGIGNALVDVLSQESDEFVESTGVPKGSMTLIDEGPRSMRKWVPASRSREAPQQTQSSG